jgi:hypothetical protein
MIERTALGEFVVKRDVLLLHTMINDWNITTLPTVTILIL